MIAEQFQIALLHWFDQYGRKNLPWQKNKTAYRVWVSEIMLQQTQVATVIPYFERFMQRFPTLRQLASALLDEVLHLWAGLGYYSRARNLHKAAKMIMEQFAGRFPRQVDDIVKLPGIGLSTAGAIAAVVFQVRAPILDGNVKRVLTRLQGILEPINLKTTEAKLWQLAHHYTPQERIPDYTQAIMDLGATLCTRARPKCDQCPLMKDCIAFNQGSVASIPCKVGKKTIPTRAATFLVIKKQQEVLLIKRPPQGIWGGLWSLPQVEGEPNRKQLKQFCRDTCQFELSKYQLLKPFRHTFTHYHLDIYPILLSLPKKTKIMTAQTQIWYNPSIPKPLGLPKPIQQIMSELL